jgi:two-component sensor histidine kinase/CheY-like chemotaxis protein
LGLIGSVVSQTAGNVADVEEFRHVLGGRIHALADAQNQLTERNWSFAPLQQLIEVSLSPYLNSPATVSYSGQAVELSPKAYTTLTLVVHELVTNAVKYGALNKAKAQLKIEWFVEPKQNSLVINWSERGVVIENFPRQRGFGSVIIERSVPHDLGGKANVKYGVDGLDVKLSIPLQHVTYEGISENRIDKDDGRVVERKTQRTKNPSEMEILLVEDNMIIALDLEIELQSFGFGHVLIASNVNSAMQLLKNHKIDVAVLDINLGSETSFSIAKELQKLKRPFLFLTGYSELRPDAVSEFHDVPILSKPLNKGLLHSRLQTILEKM